MLGILSHKEKQLLFGVAKDLHLKQFNEVEWELRLLEVVEYIVNDRVEYLERVTRELHSKLKHLHEGEGK